MMPIREKSIAIDGEVFVERRTETRKRTLKGGRISFNEGYGALECVVRNMSSGGARLEFGDTTGVPSHFDLKISGEPGTRRASVRWRDDRFVGVSFE